MRIPAATLLAAAALLPAAARGEEPRNPEKPEAVSKEPAEKEPATREEVSALAEEVRRLKLEVGIPEAEYRSFAGLGPAASKVYFTPKGLSIGGYGELTYENRLGDGTDEADLRRVVLYAGYRFSPLVVFNAEIEFEHGGHEVGVEFAYLDFLLDDAFRVRVGNVLVPMGFVNEMHEPPFFHGVNRPGPESAIIPTTWNENGLGVHGDVGRVRYKAYLLTGLDPIGGEVSAGSWLRRARTGGAESPAESLAGVLSLSVDLGPAAVGGAAYTGRSGQGARAADGSAISGAVGLYELHGSVAWRGLSARVLAVVGTLGDAAAISAALGLSGTDVVASRVKGGYAEVAYDILPLVLPGTAQSLTPFVRYEYQDLHDQVPAGGTRDPALETNGLVAGLTYKPLPNVALKADYQWKKPTSGGAAAHDQVNLGAGFVF